MPYIYCEWAIRTRINIRGKNGIYIYQDINVLIGWVYLASSIHRI